MKYTYITNYKDNDVLRHSFNELTERTFSFNFVEWFNNGFWGEKYIPHSFVDGEKIIANVSVNLMNFNLEGIEKHYIQIGTVMTDEFYRGQGLSRKLIEGIINEHKDNVDGIYLFGNDSVINFYPKFGFSKSTEYQYCKYTNGINFEGKIKHVNLNDNEIRRKFIHTVKNNVSNYRFHMDNFGIVTFWSTGPMSNNIYYYIEEDAYIIADLEEGTLWIHDIISTHKVNLENVIGAFDNTIKKVNLGFTPNDTSSYDIKEFHEENCTLFYLGKDLENVEKKKLKFPTLSHA